VTGVAHAWVVRYTVEPPDGQHVVMEVQDLEGQRSTVRVSRHELEVMTAAEPFYGITWQPGGAGVVGEDGKVRVLSDRCATCVFRPGARMGLSQDEFDHLISRTLDAEALLTCHSTFPYTNPEFGRPAACAGFWAQHGAETAAGRTAQDVLGVTRVAPPLVHECEHQASNFTPCKVCGA
jgi:hypothetical protein